MQTASFGGTGGASTYSIQNIIPSAPEGASVAGGVFDLQTLDDAGGMAEQYVYLVAGSDEGIEKDGWYEQDMETYAAKTFEKGEAFMINNSTGSDANMTFSGEAILTDVVVELPEFYSIKGNLCSTSISIQDLVPITTGEKAGGVFDLQTLDDAGGMAEQYVYLVAGSDEGIEKDGWYEQDMETYASRIFAPAEGFMINNSTGAKAQMKYQITK